MVFKIYYYTLFNISYTIEKVIYISYTTIMVYEKEAKKSCGIWEIWSLFYGIWDIFRYIIHHILQNRRPIDQSLVLMVTMKQAAVEVSRPLSKCWGCRRGVKAAVDSVFSSICSAYIANIERSWYYCHRRLALWYSTSKEIRDMVLYQYIANISPISWCCRSQNGNSYSTSHSSTTSPSLSFSWSPSFLILL
jgi:hypothetical protein